MKKLTPEVEAFRFTWKTGDPIQDLYRSDSSFGNNGMFYVPAKVKLNNRSMTFLVIVSDKGGWDHVSVSLGHRTPTWEEMCYIKDVFFADDEVVIQYHPAKSEYVNNHQYCLHMWRCQDQAFPMPPVEFV